MAKRPISTLTEGISKGLDALRGASKPRIGAKAREIGADFLRLDNKTVTGNNKFTRGLSRGKHVASGILRPNYGLGNLVAYPAYGYMLKKTVYDPLDKGLAEAYETRDMISGEAEKAGLSGSLRRELDDSMSVGGLATEAGRDLVGSITGKEPGPATSLRRALYEAIREEGASAASGSLREASESGWDPTAALFPASSGLVRSTAGAASRALGDHEQKARDARSNLMRMMGIRAMDGKSVDLRQAGDYMSNTYLGNDGEARESRDNINRIYSYATGSEGGLAAAADNLAGKPLVGAANGLAKRTFNNHGAGDIAGRVAASAAGTSGRLLREHVLGEGVDDPDRDGRLRRMLSAAQAIHESPSPASPGDNKHYASK